MIHVFSVEKPLPQIATGDVISVVALLLAAGVLMGITVTVLVLKIRSRKDNSSYVNGPFYPSFSLLHTVCVLVPKGSVSSITIFIIHLNNIIFSTNNFFHNFSYSLIRNDSPSRKLSQPIRKRPADDVQVHYVFVIYIS